MTLSDPNNPNTFVSEPVSPSPQENSNFFSGKTLLIVVGVVILFILIGELVWAYLKLKTNQPAATTSSSAQNIIAPTVVVSPTILSLVTPNLNPKVGDKFIVSINATSTKQSEGFDIVINYDPKMVSVVPSSLKVPVEVGNIYNTFPLNKLDTKNNQILLSGISTKGAVIPNGTLGTITFQANAPGVANLSFEFTKGKTNDTNITETGTAKDILDLVNNLTLNIKP